MSAEEKQLSVEEREQKELRERLTCIDPNNSVAVTSCAGSGKTWLLTSRIIRIILENADRLEIDDGGEKDGNGENGAGSFQLSSILAITFTNNAAAEIRNRVRERLQEMAEAEKEELDDLLEGIGVKGKYTSADIKNAYRKYLLARPPLSVFTFHSWFNHLINYLPWAMRPNLNSRVTDNPKHLKALAWQKTLMDIKDAEDESNEERKQADNKIRRLAEEAALSLRGDDTSDDEMRKLIEKARNQLLEEKKEAPAEMRMLLGRHSLRSLKDLFDELIEHRADWFLSFNSRPEEVRAYRVFMDNIKHSTPKPSIEKTRSDLLKKEFLDKLTAFLCGVMNDYLSGTFATKVHEAVLDKMPNLLEAHAKLKDAAEAGAAKRLLDEDFLEELVAFLEQVNKDRKLVNAVVKIQAARQQNNSSSFFSTLKYTLEETVTLKKAANHPDLETLYAQVIADLQAVTDTEAYEYNKACARIGLIYARNYAQIKRDEGVIDYADMEIFPLTALFMNASRDDLGELNSTALAELLLRLDSSYSHILVDEFQDTNPAQWLMLKAWLHHSKHKPRVFIVGDPKQSIFSWRGSNPKLLGVAEDYIRKNYAGKPPVSVSTTRRCSKSVIDLVNKVFVSPPKESGGKEAKPKKPSGLVLEGFVPHLTLDTAKKGSVACLPLRATDPEADGGNDGSPLPESLRNPLKEKAPETEESARYAMLEGDALSKEIHEIKSNDSGYRDKHFMLLHPTKTHAQPLTDGLASNDLGCALMDKASRMSHLECEDMLALLHAVFDPDYGLMVAQILRSPVFNLDEDDLWRVFSAGRTRDGKRCDWFTGLANAAQEGGASERLKEAHCSLDRWRTIYRQEKLPAHELLSRCYADAHIIDRYAEKVPPEIAKRVILNLEWILNYSLEAMEGSLALPSEYAEHLQKLKEADEDISPDAGQENVIQSLTVHGAKGLESPAVAIANCNYGSSDSGPRLLVSWNLRQSDQKPSHFSFLRSPNATTELQEEAKKNLEEMREQEKRNLLYVAMTRAKEHLIFSVMPKKKLPKSPGKSKTLRWWNEIDKRLSKLAGAQQDKDGVWRYVTSEEPVQTSQKMGAKEKTRPLAGWPTEEDPPVPKILTKKKDPATEDMVRGTQLHNLLALILQGVSNGSVQRRLLGIGVEQQDDLKEKTETILDRNEEDNFGRLRDYIGGDASSSRRVIGCEVPAVDGDGKQKRIDCLLTPDDCKTVWIIDFKMGNAERQKAEHENQLRDYQAIVSHQNNYPKATVKMAIVYEDGSRWIVD